MARVSYAQVEFLKTHENGATETILADIDANGYVLVSVDALTDILGQLGFERVHPEPDTPYHGLQ